MLHGYDEYYITPYDKKENKSEFSGLHAALMQIRKIYSYKYTTNDFRYDLSIKLRDDSSIKQGKTSRIIKRKTKKYEKIRSSFDRNLNRAIMCTDKILKIDSLIYMLENITVLKYSDSQKTKKIRNLSDTLISKLRSYRKRLEKKTLKHMDEADKRRGQLENLGSVLSENSKLQNRERYFVLRIFQDAKEVLNVSKENDLYEQVYKKNREISDQYDERIEKAKSTVDEIFEQISKINMQLSNINNPRIESEIKEEIVTIRRTVKPSVTTISAENLEKLKKSKQVIDGVETFIEEVSHSPFIGLKNRRERAIYKKLEELEKRLRSLLAKERKEHTSLNLEQGEIRRELELIKSALRNYQAAIEQEKNKENIAEITKRQNEQIQKQIDQLDRKLAKYIEKHGTWYESGHEIRGGEPRLITGKYDYSKEISELNDDRKKLTDKQDENIRYKNHVEQRPVEIPERYRNLKDKLKTESPLRTSILKGIGKKGKTIK